MAVENIVLTLSYFFSVGYYTLLAINLLMSIVWIFPKFSQSDKTTI